MSRKPSIGLGRIINDPKASVLTRKALGVLSNPALLVNDQGVTIDDEGRFALKLKAGGGITEDADGLSAAFPVNPDGGLVNDPMTGLAVKPAPGGGLSADSAGLAVTYPLGPGVEAGSGVWNVLMTGTAANHFAGTVAIGSETLTAKLSVMAITEQFRVQYNASNYMSVAVSAAGAASLTAVGTAADISLLAGSGRGVRINNGAVIKRVITGIATVALVEGTYDYAISVPGNAAGDSVIVCPVGMPGTYVISWCGVALGSNTVVLRVQVAAGSLGGGSVAQQFRATVIGF